MAAVLTRDASGRSAFRWKTEVAVRASAEAAVGPARRAGVRGCELVARRRVARGTVVLRREAVAYVVDGAHCALCASDLGAAATRCATCLVRHCDAACAAADDDHTATCSADVRHASQSCRLAARVLRRADPNYIDALIENDDERSDDDDGALSAAAIVVARLLAGTAADGALIRPVLRKLRRNCHTMTDDELRSLAANHSCVPNVWPRFEVVRRRRPVLEFVALREIAKGEELTHEYADVAPDRPEKLRRDHGFTCACGACVGGRDLQRETVLVRFAAQRDAIEAAIAARDFGTAAAVADAATADFEAAYVEGHPHRALHHLRAGKLLLAVNEHRRARPHLEAALRLLERTHGGPGARLIAEACDLLHQVRDRDEDGDEDG